MKSIMCATILFGKFSMLWVWYFWVRTPAVVKIKSSFIEQAQKMLGECELAVNVNRFYPVKNFARERELAQENDMGG